MKRFASLVILAVFVANSYGLCTWTFQNCDRNHWCYYKGNGGCAGYSCQMELRHDGQVRIWNDGYQVANGYRDMSRYPHDNCTMLYTYS